MIITLKSIEVYDADLPGTYEWDAGISSCAELCAGWRMPTKNELDEMWKKRKEIGGFIKAYYWCASAYDENYAGIQSFINGVQFSDYKHFTNRVRPVRDVV